MTTLAVVFAIAWTGWRDYQNALREVEHKNLSLARLLDEHITRSLVSVEQAMQNVSEDIERAGGIEHVNERWGHERLKEKVQLTPQIRAIIAIDRHGILRAHGLEYPTRQVSLGDRDYFSYHRDMRDTRPRIGEPIVSRTDYKWLLPVTLRINHPDGEFGGVMLSGVEPNYYLRFYESLQLERGTRFQIVRNDGAILMTYPLDTALLGRNLKESDPAGFESLRGGQTTFYRQQTKNTDAFVTQLVNQTDLPLVVRISTDHTQVFAKFRSEIFTKVGAALVLTLVVSIMLYLLIRQINRVEESESRLYLTQFTVDESPDMILWCDHTGRVRYANRSMIESSGYGLRDLLSLRYPDLLINDEDSWEYLRLQMIALHQHHARHDLLTELQAQRRQVMETHLRCRDGHTTPVEITVSLIEFNEETYLCVSARDITERQEAERELRRHRDHLQDMVAERTAEIHTVLDASPLAITLMVQNHIRLVNPAFENLFGYTATHIVGMQDSAIHESKQNTLQIRESINRRILAGGTYRGEVEMRRKDGTAFWAVLFAKALAPDAPERGMIMIIEDITAQRIAAQAIRQSERLRRTIINTTSDCFALIDNERRFVDVNASFCNTLGLSREKLISQRCEVVLGELAGHLFPSDPNQADKHFKEIEIPSDNNPHHPFLANGGVIPDENGNTEYAFVFLTDISRQKDVERTLLEAKNSAEAANNAKTLFLANMSHELRTPMHAILSFSEMGNNKGGHASPEQIVRYFERIHTSGKRLLALLNDLLDMSRLEANKMTYDKSRHILQVTARGAVTEISSLLTSKQLTINIDDATGKLLLVYDKARIMQVLVNLLSNAIKFSPAGALIHISFIHEATLENGQPAAGLMVRDNGPGIPESDLELIFETFGQSKTSSVGGTGLGLAICRQIMLDHNGSITAHNHLSGGAVFTILLPCQEEGAKTIEVTQPAA